MRSCSRRFASRLLSGSFEEKHPRVEDQRAGQATAELRGVLVTEAGQAHHLEHLGRARGDPAPRPFADLQRVGHVLEDGHVRPHRVGLEHHPHAALLGGHEDPVARGRHGLAVDGNRALVGMLESRDAAEGRRLAAAARAEQGEDPSLLHAEGDPLDRGLAAEALAQPRRLDVVTHVQ
jgi:hypothetical protein